MGMSEDLTRWGAFILAGVSAFGGFLGSAVSNATQEAQVKTTLEQLAVAFHDHDKLERENDVKVGERLSNLEARIQFLEKPR